MSTSSIYLQKSAWIKPRTSPPLFGTKALTLPLPCLDSLFTAKTFCLPLSASCSSCVPSSHLERFRAAMRSRYLLEHLTMLRKKKCFCWFLWSLCFHRNNRSASKLIVKGERAREPGRGIAIVATWWNLKLPNIFCEIHIERSFWTIVRRRKWHCCAPLVEKRTTSFRC